MGGGEGGGLFACSFAYGLDEAGGEVAHAVVAGAVVMDAALPAPIRVLLQHLWAVARSGDSDTSGVLPAPPATLTVMTSPALTLRLVRS